MAVRNKIVGWVEQGETQHTQPKFLVLRLDDVYVESDAPTGGTRIRKIQNPKWY
jgi:hypothetical protein